ncbi:pectate lyase [Rugosimonospora africana]|uniref:pectate lyase n=1 Tax=Rugosimonospora africana TaxID=556532 RepID=A0A8J3VWK8_9ACTN|nr:pectate lyase [Rugosimonospora africana]GIH20966.1 hypothetical protein Raf01_91380 [Rugosimonospora africana]
MLSNGRILTRRLFTRKPLTRRLLTRRRRIALLGGALAASTALAAAAVTTVSAQAAAAGCRVAYSVTSQWPGGFTGSLAITNLGDPLTAWTLKFSFTAGQQVTSGWNGTFSQSGSAVTVTDAGYNGALGTGASTSAGFNATWTSANPAPASFTLNGVACTGNPTTITPTPTGTRTSAPSPTPTRTSPTPTPTRTTAPPTGGNPPAWPTATGSVTVTATIKVSGTYDGQLRRYTASGLGGGDQDEDQQPVFDLPSGGTLQNVIIGAPGVDGIHCEATCTLRNVWWEDVGEDAATLKGSSSSQTMTIDGGGARHADDKVFQHNGPGTFIIRNFQVSDFGKLYRSCGNCSSQYKRSVQIQNVWVTSPGSAIAGINTNYGDSARFSGITIIGDSSRKISICDKYTGNDDGDEPVKTGSGADSTYCLYSSSDITYR